jgi:hypothetical protein
MSSQLSWATPPGTIANFPIGNLSFVELIAVDTKNSGATLTFSKISGELPPGMTLSPQGEISGTPVYSTISNNYFIKLNYDFIVRVTTSDGRVLDGKFTIVIANTVNQDFYWVTPPGNLGTIPNGQFYSLRIEADSTANLGITYSFVSGELPPGMQLISQQVDKTITIPQTIPGNQLKISNTQTISVNDFVFGDKIPPDTRVAGVDSINNIVTLTASTTAVTNIGDTIKFYTPGLLQGVPTILDSVVVNESRTYRFTIRAINSLGRINDRAFSLNVTNISAPIIQPETESLGSYFDGIFFSKQLSVSQLNPEANIKWSVVTGDLPPGLELDQTGLISGYLTPIELVGKYGPAGYDSNNSSDIGKTGTFSNCNISGTVLSVGTVDQGTIVTGMTLTGAGVVPDTQIVAKITEWDRNTSYLINDVVLYQSVYYKANQNILAGSSFKAAQWDVTTGTQNQWRVSPYQNVTGNVTISGVVYSSTTAQEYDKGPYQFNQINSSTGYTFTVQAFDGANYDLQTYNIRTIASRTGWTADNDIITVDDGFLNVDGVAEYYPFIRNTSTTLPTGRQNSYYAFKIDGYDWDVGTDGLTYSIVDTLGTYDGSPFDPLNRDDLNNGLPGSFDLVSATTSNLPGVELDADTGWIYGLLNPQTTALEEFTFGIKVCKTQGNVEYCSDAKYFTLPVLGDPNSTITWITDSDLGTINNGTISEMFLEARSAAGKELVYTLVDEVGVSCRLPQGLKLLPSGEISGRVTFESFGLDDYSTTFDGEKLTIDRTAVFTVRAETIDQTSSLEKTFTLKLNLINKEPYESLYLQAMPSFEQRQIYNQLISNSDIFDPEFIYRPTDAYFGVQEDLRMLFLPGLTASELTDYQQAMIKNHFNKTYQFGEVKTAYVFNETFDIKYEVVYVEIIDPGQNKKQIGSPLELGPPLEIDLSNQIENPYIDREGNTYTTVYPNSSENMTARIEDGIGYQDQSSLPPWMTSNQPDPTSVTGFTTPLGYTKAVVIAYAKPGAGEKIAYRIKQSGIDFNRIEFIVDRYQLDNYYTSHYNIDTTSYINDRETLFDSDPNVNIGSIVASVTYAVTVPFSQINGRPINYINSNGGIDGITDFRDGETLIFVQQEQFVDAGPYDGWVDYSNSFIGDNTETAVVEGFDSSSYDTYTVIPGFLEKVQATSPVNRRGGIWRIEITNSIVNLVFVRELEVNDRVKILFGKTLSSAILIYSLDLTVGLTVPYYKVFTVNPTIRQRTTFNNDTTKFFTYRDQYYESGEQDKYVKFPQYGVFD